MESIENTEEAEEVAKAKASVTANDNIQENITQDIIKELYMKLLKNRVIKQGKASQKLLVGKTNAEVFNNLKNIAEQHNLDILDIITKCK